MAALLWGRVYYQNYFAGELRELPGDRCQFVYDQSYLDSNQPAIAHTLPLQPEPFISQLGLHSFFDNLVAEGWLAAVQTRLLGKRQSTRFELLLAFGQDCAGAVSVIDPTLEPVSADLLNLSDPKERLLLTNRASLSGVQPKIALVKKGKRFRAAKADELSSYIAKFPSPQYPDLIDNEYITMQAFQALLPQDQVAEVTIDSIQGLDAPALIIKRFDRIEFDKKTGTINRKHFEEFNQLLNYPCEAKYDGSYKTMADFMRTNRCLPVEIYRLYQRISAGILLGNTDMHFKNFAMTHNPEGLRLTPSYDQVAAALYDYKTIALELAGAKNFRIGKLNARHLIRLGKEFELTDAMIQMAVDQLENQLDGAESVIQQAVFGAQSLKDSLTQLMRKRWNGTFALIGKQLSKKR